MREKKFMRDCQGRKRNCGFGSDNLEKRGFGGRGFHKNWQGHFRNCGYRITISREAILNVLMKSKSKHMSAEDIYMQVHSSYPDIGLATIYRTLDILTGMNVVAKTNTGDGRYRYELINQDKKNIRYHLICQNCKQIIGCEEISDNKKKELDKIIKDLSKKYKFETTNQILQIYGLCEDCKKTGGN